MKHTAQATTNSDYNRRRSGIWKSVGETQFTNKRYKYNKRVTFWLHTQSPRNKKLKHGGRDLDHAQYWHVTKARGLWRARASAQASEMGMSNNILM